LAGLIAASPNDDNHCIYFDICFLPSAGLEGWSPPRYVSWRVHRGVLITISKTTSFIAKELRWALTLATMCVGGMVLALTLPDQNLADELRNAARNSALRMLNID